MRFQYTKQSKSGYHRKVSMVTKSIKASQLGLTKLDFEVRPSLHKFSTSHLPQTRKLLSLQTTIKKNPQSAPLDLSYLLTYSLVLAQSAMCVKPADLLTRYVPSLWKLSHAWKKPTLILIFTNPYWLLYCVINDYVLILQNAGGTSEGILALSNVC